MARTRGVGRWLDRAVALAGRALRRPDRVLETLASLRPMAEVGPVTIEEVRDVLRDRLVMLDWETRGRRYGRVFIGTPHQARGRSFRVVFVPGLAERVVPQRPHEDPLLLDERRAGIGGLVNQDARKNAERLLLKLAIGAATDRVYLSYPRLDVAETRVRVPSFYALDVVRAITGEIPDHRQLALGMQPKPRQPRMARRKTRRDRRSRATCVMTDARVADPRWCAGTRTAPAQRVAAAVRHQPVDAGPEAGPSRRTRSRGALPSRRRSSHRLASRPLAVRPAALLVVSMPVPARDDYRLDRATKPERWSARSVDAQRPVSPRASRFYRAGESGRAARYTIGPEPQKPSTALDA